MQPEDVVQAAAIDILERPDLVELGRSSFRNALHQCHGFAEFSRDLTQAEILRPELNYFANHTAIQFRLLPGVVRRIINIVSMLDMQILDSEFKQVQAGAISSVNYYGYTHRSTYSILGDTINLNGVSENFTSIRLLYLTFPTVELDEAGDLTANSWILDEFPDLVVANLAFRLAKLTQDKDLISSVNSELGLKVSTLFQNFGTEILNPNVQGGG